MPPPLPRDAGQREQIWGTPRLDPTMVEHSHPLESTPVLDGPIRSLTNLFPHMRDFLRSRFGLARSTDQQWFPVRPLGQGGFGGVAVWERRDAAGNVLEETAVKQTKAEKDLALDSDPYMAKEAAIMQQLNSKSSENIVYLKNFKCFISHQGQMVTWRFYFEYCPYVDLGRLARRYKYWGTYLAEEFLWRVFDSLASVAEKMEEPGYFDPDTRQCPDDPYVVIHSDIKPINVFLGYHSRPRSPWHPYPVIKLGDWGLAKLTNQLDERNPETFVKVGTSWYLPPESRSATVRARYFAWKNPPFDHTPFTRQDAEATAYQPAYMNRLVDNSHNTFAIGRVMYELLTHQHPKILSDHLDTITEMQYNSWGKHTVPPIVTKKTPEYSYELRQLIRQCLNMRPSLRPSPQYILKETGAKCRHYEGKVFAASNSAQKRGPGYASGYQLPRLYYQKNDINLMPLGHHVQDFGLDEKCLANFVYGEDQYAGPVWGPIKHPLRVRFDRKYQELAQKKKQEAKEMKVNKGNNPVQMSSSKKQLSEQGEREFGPLRVGQAQAQQAGEAEGAEERVVAAGAGSNDADEALQRNVRNKKMRVWDDNRPPNRAQAPIHPAPPGPVPVRFHPLPKMPPSPPRAPFQPAPPGQAPVRFHPMSNRSRDLGQAPIHPAPPGPVPVRFYPPPPADIVRFYPTPKGEMRRQPPASDDFIARDEMSTS